MHQDLSMVHSKCPTKGCLSSLLARKADLGRDWNMGQKPSLSTQRLVNLGYRLAMALASQRLGEFINGGGIKSIRTEPLEAFRSHLVMLQIRKWRCRRGDGKLALVTLRSVRELQLICIYLLCR